MLGAQRLLIDRQAALVKRLGFAIAALGSVEFREVVEVSGDMGMLGAQRLLPDLKAALEKWLSLAIAALFVIEVR
jgi:hypothetical protein